MANYKAMDADQLDSNLTSVANAIREKGGTSDALAFPGGFVSAISGIQTGGGGTVTPSAKWNDVTFIDYDGAVLYSYTLAEAQALTALPALPAHDGLICQGWNWSMESIKALNRPVTVGAMYITDDGATRLHIRISTPDRKTVPLYIIQTVSNGVSINWGDGSDAETLNGTGTVNTTHTYAAPGDYTISLMPEDGCTLSFGDGTNGYCVMGERVGYDEIYLNMLQSVSIGRNVTAIGTYAFYNSYSLTSITIPNSVNSIGTDVFYRCYSLTSITIPNGVTTIGDNLFIQCYSLASVTIPDGVTSIGAYAFSNCYAIASITIPDSVNAIGANAFYYCHGLTSIIIPEGMTSIENYMVGFCYNLTSITIPEGVTTIGAYAFRCCYRLTSITIPDGVTSIGAYAFSLCPCVDRFTIPNSVTSFGNNLFQHSKGVRYFDFSTYTSVPTLQYTNIFDGVQDDFKILIPSALFSKWKAATNWTTYKSHMVAV